MSANFIDFTNPQNSLVDCDFILLDTCSILNLVTENQDALNFVHFTIQNDITLCYAMKSVEELTIIQEANIIPKNKRIARPNMTSYIQQSQIKTDSILNALHLLPNMYPEPIGAMSSEIWKEVKSNAVKHQLRLGDAVIYTQAKKNDINYIWTYDSDWVNVQDKDMNILTYRRYIPSNNIIDLPSNVNDISNDISNSSINNNVGK